METLLEKISSLKILVIGDLILDHYVWGDASRISPEAPVPVIEVDRDSYTAGGAANVALNVSALGASAEICGILGDDESGQHLGNLLAESNVPVDAGFITTNKQTVRKTRIIAGQQQLCRLDHESTPENYRIDLDTFGGLIAQKAQAADAVILSDYAKGVVSAPLIKLVQDAAKKSQTLVAYDPKPKGLVAFDGVDILKPNRSESFELAGIAVEQHSEYPAVEVCRAIWQKYHPGYLIISLGAEGMLHSERGKVISRIPTYAREVFDVTGAGDTVIASLATAMAAGSTIEEAVHLANTAAGVVVAHVGAAVARPQEIIDYAARHE